MAAIWAQVIAWVGKAGTKVAGIAAVLISFIYIHNSAKRKAAKQAVKEERQRIQTTTRIKRQEIRKQADEIDKNNADVDSADLRKRMRNQATDSGD
jgi:hypothetical protein